MIYSKSRLKRDLLSISIIMLALFGGMQFYLYPAILRTGIILGFGLLAWGGWLVVRGAKIPFGPSLFWLVAAVIFSVVSNWDIYPASLGRVWLYSVAVAVLVIGYHHLNERQIYAGIYRAGWVWGLGWPLFYGLGDLWPVWGGSHNIFAFWSVVFVAVGLYGRNWLYLLPHLVALLFFGSRGAIIGTAAVFVVATWPALWRSKYVVALSSPLIVLAAAWLVSWRPHTALIRLHYWQCAWDALRENWLFGVGPAGLRSGRWIDETGTQLYQIHAHNSLITWAAETGIIGLVCLGAAAHTLRTTPYVQRPWQLAALGGIAAHSMVDEPLWWPGPLLVAALVVSVCKKC